MSEVEHYQVGSIYPDGSFTVLMSVPTPEGIRQVKMCTSVSIDDHMLVIGGHNMPGKIEVIPQDAFNALYGDPNAPAPEPE